MSLTAKEVDEAWGIMGGSSAAKNARLRLLEVLNGLCPQASNASALLLHEGRRTLARELLTLLDAGISNDGRKQPDDHAPRHRPGVGGGVRRSYRRVSERDPNA